MRYNPFKPNSPVGPGMFVGRMREVERLEYLLAQTREGNPGGFLLTGERGIGKSSLLLYARALADGAEVAGKRLRFIVIHTDVDATTTQIGLIRKIELGLRFSLEENERGRGAVRKFWEFLQRVEAGGVSLRDRSSAAPNETVIEEAAYSLAQTINAITTQRLASEFGVGDVYDGALLLLDEADNASKELQLGAFLKLLIERVQRAGCDRLCVGVAGLPTVVDALRRSHESSLRLFEQLPLGVLSPTDQNAVIDIGLDLANQKNSVPTTIDEDARNGLVYFSEGFPHFLQQFAYSAFAQDSDNHISAEDVLDAAFGNGGAYELIGNRYYRDAFYNKIRQDSYRQVLHIMAGEPAGWVKKATIRAKFKGLGSTLDNAIHALTKRGLIVKEPGTLGSYRLVHRGFAHWIRVFTLNPDAIRQLILGDASQSSAAASGTGDDEEPN